MPASLARSCLNNSINNLQYEHNVQNTEAGFQKGNRRIKMPALAEVCTDCPECLVLTADRSHHGPRHQVILREPVETADRLGGFAAVVT